LSGRIVLLNRCIAP